MLSPKSVYIAFEAFPRPKGASAHIASMVMAMAKKYGSTLLLCLGFGDMPSYQIEGNIIIKRFKAYHPNMLKRSEMFSRFVYDTLDNPDLKVKLCIFRDPWSGIAALSANVCKNIVFEVNALPSWELEYTYPGFAKNYSLKSKIEDMEYFCLENSHKLLTISEATSKALQQKGIPAGKIKVIPNSAPDFFFTAPEKEIMPDFLKTGRWIGYFGSLHSWQGIEEGIKAFALIYSDFPDLNMVIITGGKKEAKKKLRKIVRKCGLEDQVLFHSPLMPEKLAAIVRHLEFTLAPLADTPRNTKQGCCPIKIIESMAAKVPVIASDLSCIRPLINHDLNGILVPPGNLRALALAMKKCLMEKEKTQLLGKNAFQKALSDYNRDKIHKELTAYLE